MYRKDCCQHAETVHGPGDEQGLFKKNVDAESQRQHTGQGRCRKRKGSRLVPLASQSTQNNIAQHNGTDRKQPQFPKIAVYIEIVFCKVRQNLAQEHTVAYIAVAQGLHNKKPIHQKP